MRKTVPNTKKIAKFERRNSSKNKSKKLFSKKYSIFVRNYSKISFGRTKSDEIM